MIVSAHSSWKPNIIITISEENDYFYSSNNRDIAKICSIENETIEHLFLDGFEMKKKYGEQEFIEDY